MQRKRHVWLRVLLGVAAGMLAASCAGTGPGSMRGAAGEQIQVELATSPRGRAVAEYNVDDQEWLEGELWVWGTEHESVLVRRMGTRQPEEQLWSRRLRHIPWVAVRGDGESVVVSCESDPRGTGVRMKQRFNGAGANAVEPFPSSDLIIERVGRDGKTLASVRLVRSSPVTGGRLAPAVPCPSLVEYGAGGDRVYLWLEMAFFTRVLEFDAETLRQRTPEREMQAYDDWPDSRREFRVGRPVSTAEHVFVLLAESGYRRWHLAIMSVDGRLLSRVEDLQRFEHSRSKPLELRMRRSGRGAEVVGAAGEPLLEVFWRDGEFHKILWPGTIL